MMQLTNFDKDLLNLLQSDLPICDHPFAKLADELDSDEETVLTRLRELKDEGYLRRIGTFFNSAKLGYKGTLLAAKVEPDKMADVAEAINQYPGITHNYQREGNYNLWFTLITPNPETEQKIVAEIQQLDGIDGDLLNLKANKKYKINVQFKLH